MEHREKAEALFLEGYNCAQAVFAAFCDVTGMEEQAALRLSSSFGGGFGRMREVCGAFSGLCMAAGWLYGYTDPGCAAEKKEHYARVQSMAEEFRAEFGSIVCRDILKKPDDAPNPTPRTAEFYHVRPCARCVGTAAEILDRYIREHPTGNEIKK